MKPGRSNSGYSNRTILVTFDIKIQSESHFVKDNLALSFASLFVRQFLLYG